MIKLVRAGRTAKQLAKEFEPTAQTISRLGGAGRPQRYGMPKNLRH
jgi:hypothetical protein